MSFVEFFLFVLQTKHSIEFKRLIFPIDFLLNSLSFLLVIKKNNRMFYDDDEEKNNKNKNCSFSVLCAL